MKRFLVFSLALVVLNLLLPFEVHAQAVPPTYITSDTTWSPDDGVYFIESGFTVPAGVTLTIEAGTIIKSRSTNLGGPSIYGNIIVLGTESEPVYFTSLFDDSIGGDTDGLGPTPGSPGDWQGLYFKEGSTGNFDHTVLRFAGHGGFGFGNFIGIENDGGSIEIRNSRITSNKMVFGGGMIGTGIKNLSGSLTIENSVIDNNIIGIYNDFGAFTTTNSIFDANTFALIVMGGDVVATPGNSFDASTTVQNSGTTTIDMRQNWWGSVTGPRSVDRVGEAEGSFIYGPILFEPWLLQQPGEEPAEECCSSVLFLPGIKGSVLKSGSDTLWPATFLGNDLPALALDENGESVNDVYVDGILQEFTGLNIYLPFSTFLDGLVSENLISDWLPLAYDWRFSIDKVLSEGVKTETGVLDIFEAIEELAANSQTGQVAIVAHSMGGLLGKAIIKELEERGEDNLIDSFVMVGTPQLGTPQAAGVLLHGYDEGILGGFIVSSAQARTLSQNLPSAYNLLPSRQYFEEVLDPVITFDLNASFTQEWQDFWNGTSTKGYEDTVEFITGTGVPREEPGELDLRTPEVLRMDLVTSADGVHQTYDNYVIPSHIRTVQVAGWGFLTAKAVHYRNRHGQPSYDVSLTVEGDKTVVYPSAISLANSESYFFDLATYNALEDTPDFQHRNLLSSQPIQDLVRSLITEAEVVTDTFIRTTKPDPNDLSKALIVSAHSPVIMGVYDNVGNFTGIDPNQDLSKEILSITEDIPGSTFLYTSESQYIFLPKEGTYNFIYKGTGTGSTTIEIQDFVADGTTLLASYSDISTTESTSATFVVDTENLEGTIIKVDTNSDGETDELYLPDEISLTELFKLLRTKIISLNIKDKAKSALLKKLDNLEKKIEKKKAKGKSLEAIKKRIENVIRKIMKKEERGAISEADSQEITKLLEQIESAL